MSKRFAAWLMLALAAVFAGVASAHAAGAASPFIPAGSKPAPVAPASDKELDALELSGISFIGEQKMFNFVNPKTKQSFWVALGATEHGFKVESYDAEADAVVLRKGNFTRRLALRQSQIVAAAPPSNIPPLQTAPDVPAKNVAGVDEIKNPKTPEEIKQAEFEARMLVSDLLEISMQERARQRALRQAKQNSK